MTTVHGCGTARFDNPSRNGLTGLLSGDEVFNFPAIKMYFNFLQPLIRKGNHTDINVRLAQVNVPGCPIRHSRFQRRLVELPVQII